jgi:hypothetical protein
LRGPVQQPFRRWVALLQSRKRSYSARQISRRHRAKVSRSRRQI